MRPSFEVSCLQAEVSSLEGVRKVCHLVIGSICHHAATQDDLFLRVSDAVIAAKPQTTPEAQLVTSCEGVGLQKTLRFSELTFVPAKDGKHTATLTVRICPCLLSLVTCLVHLDSHQRWVHPSSLSVIFATYFG